MKINYGSGSEMICISQHQSVSFIMSNMSGQQPVKTLEEL